MAFEAARREWCELYTFFRLPTEGRVTLGTAKTKKGEIDRSIAMVQRKKHNETRCYYIEKEMVRIRGGSSEKFIPRKDFEIVIDLILQTVKSSSEDEVASPDGAEEFLDEVAVFDLEAKTEDHTDFYIAFWHSETPLSGFSVCSRLGAMNPLLDGDRAANLRLEQSRVKFTTPTVNKINALPEAPNEIAERILLVERLGGVLKYSNVADQVFHSNLLMIDLCFPHVLTKMVRIMHLDGITRISGLAGVIKQMNLLKIKDKLVNKHGFYEFKVKQFLMALALGMYPAKIYTEQGSTIEGILLMDGSGEILYHHKLEKLAMENFLFLNTRLERGSLDRDRYGLLERENDTYYFKLNAKIRLVKQ